MKPDRRFVPDREPWFGLSVALLLAVGSQAGYRDCVAAAETHAAAALASSDAAPAPEEGAEWLKRQTQITVETNRPPAAAATNGIAPKEKSFRWKAAWEGWNGLHLELTRKTLLGQWVPGVTNADRLNPEGLVRKLRPGESAPEGTNVRILRLEERRMSGKIGAKFAVDAAAYATGEEFHGYDAGVELRRARLYAKGDCLLVLPVSYQIELGYIPDEFYIEESYLAFKNIRSIGELRFGQYQAPMGLDVINSSRDITFMEPASPLQALAPGVNAGLQMSQPVLHDRATWTLGFFTDGVGQDFGDASTDFGRAIARLTALPIDRSDPDQPDSARFLHMGLSANILYSGNSTVRYQARPESHLAPYVVDTGDISSQGALVLGAEAAWVNGPFSIQGEYLHSFVEQTGGSALNFDGLYVSASWFLTGESRPYNRTEGVFGRVAPKRALDFRDGDWGAWEVAARLSYVDLDHGDVEGGRLAMLMGGVNWHLHSHVKWRFNYGFGHVSGHAPAGNLNIFETRIEIDF